MYNLSQHSKICKNFYFFTLIFSLSADSSTFHPTRNLQVQRNSRVSFARQVLSKPLTRLCFNLNFKQMFTAVKAQGDGSMVKCIAAIRSWVVRGRVVVSLRIYL